MTATLPPASNFSLAPLLIIPSGGGGSASIPSTQTYFPFSTEAEVSRFPVPSPENYGAVVWPRNLYPNVGDAWIAGVAEIVTVTARDVTGKKLTVERGAQGTTALDLNLAGATYWLQAGMTAAEWSALDGHLMKNVGGVLTTTKGINTSGSLVVGGTVQSGSQAVSGAVVATGAVTAGGQVTGGSLLIGGAASVNGAGAFTGAVSGASGSFSGAMKAGGPNPWIDVTSSAYGADPTGVADSKTAIQAALTAAQAVVATGGSSAVVFIPPGTYDISGPLTCTGGVRIVGAGFRGGTTLSYTGTDGADLLTFYDSGESHSACGVEGIRFLGTADENSGRAVLFHNVFGGTMERCQVTAFGGGSVTITARQAAVEFKEDSGATSKNSAFHSVRDCYFNNNLGGGLRIGTSNTVTVAGCEINSNNKYGLYVNGSHSIRVEGCTFYEYGRDVNGVTDFSYAVVVGDGSSSVTVADCRMQAGAGDVTTSGCAVKTGHDGHAQAADTTENSAVSVERCYFPAYDYTDCLTFAYTRGWRVAGCHFLYSTNTDRNGIVLPATGATNAMAWIVGNVWGASVGGTIFPESNRVVNSANMYYAMQDTAIIGAGGEAPLMKVVAPSGQEVTEVFLTGESYPRQWTDSHGGHYWGDGAGAADLALTRDAASLAKLLGSIYATGYFQLGSTSGPKFTSGTGVPSDSDPDGSVYLRTDGAAATTMYVRVSSSWNVVTTT